MVDKILGTKNPFQKKNKDYSAPFQNQKLPKILNRKNFPVFFKLYTPFCFRYYIYVSFLVKKGEGKKKFAQIHWQFA